MKTVVRLEYAKVHNMISVKLRMRFKRNGHMNPLFVIVTRTPNVIPCLIRHVLSKIVLNHICGAHSVSNLQSPVPSPLTPSFLCSLFISIFNRQPGLNLNQILSYQSNLQQNYWGVQRRFDKEVQFGVQCFPSILRNILNCRYFIKSCK